MHQKGSSIINLSSLIDWYMSNCDGDWEHTYGVMLQTLDNPGWWLTVDLKGTELDGAKIEPICEGCDTQNNPNQPSWIHCRIEDNVFSAACNPIQLPRLFIEFERFRDLKKNQTQSN